jgi:hypothetical protein
MQNKHIILIYICLKYIIITKAIFSAIDSLQLYVCSLNEYKQLYPWLECPISKLGAYSMTLFCI